MLALFVPLLALPLSEGYSESIVCSEEFPSDLPEQERKKWD
jgi:hypothetical protein